MSCECYRCLCDRSVGRGTEVNLNLAIKQKGTDICKMDISTITRDVFLQEKNKKNILWMNGNDRLGLFQRSFTLEYTHDSLGFITAIAYKFSEKEFMIAETFLFPQAPVAVSPSIECNSSTVKIDSSATGNVGGSATA